jgi:hypothetical protein
MKVAFTLVVDSSSMPHSLASPPLAPLQHRSIHAQPRFRWRGPSPAPSAARSGSRRRPPRQRRRRSSRRPIATCSISRSSRSSSRPSSSSSHRVSGCASLVSQVHHWNRFFCWGCLLPELSTRGCIQRPLLTTCLALNLLSPTQRGYRRLIPSQKNSVFQRGSCMHACTHATCMRPFVFVSSP